MVKQLSFFIFVRNSENVRITTEIIRNDMKKLFTLFNLMFWALTFSMSAYSQNTSFPIKSDHYIKILGTSQGLSQPGITAVLTDASGSVWIGTRYRLNKYVNGRIETYDVSQTGGSAISLVFEDSSGRIWIGTESSLALYDPNTDNFIEKIPGRKNCALEYEGKIYFAGSGDISVLDLTTDTFSEIETPSSYIIECAVLKPGVILFVDKFSGVYRYLTSTGRLETFDIPEIAHTYILSAAISDGYLYLGSFFNGLYKFDSNGRICARYKPEEYPELNLEVICDISVIDSRIFLATDGSGLCTIENDRVVGIDKIPGYADLTTLPKALTKVEQDRFSNIWVGSVKDGLFGIKQTLISADSYMSNQLVFSMCQDGRNLWIGTDDGIVGYNPVSGSFRRLGSNSGDIVASIALFGPDKLLAYVYCKGLRVINKSDGSSEPLKVMDSKTDSLEKYSGYNLFSFNVSDNEVLLAGENVYLLDARTGKFSLLTADDGASRAELHPFYVDRSGRWAYAFSHTAIYKLDILTKRIAKLATPSFDFGRINTAACDGNKVYIGTDTGMIRFDEQSLELDVPLNIFKRVTCMSERDEGLLWIVSDNILYSYDTHSNRVEIYDEAEGFSSREVTCSARLGDCRYFGGNYNLFAVPQDIHRNVNSDPSLKISAISFNGKKVQGWEDSKLRLRPGLEELAIRFNLIGGDPFRRTLVRYILEGPEHVTTETHRPEFSLASLAPGKYSLKASYLKSDGQWSSPVEYLKITMPDVVWHRKWFIGLVILILFVCIVAFVQHINRNADMEISKTQEAEKVKRTRFIKSVDAELRKPLTLIGSTAKSVMEDVPDMPDSAQEKLERIFTKSVQMQQIISDAVEQVAQEEEDPLIVKLNGIIDEHIGNNELGVALLVREMGMSRTVLYDKLKSSTGMGVNEYVQKRRLIRARRLLIDTDMSVAEISDSLGFSSPKYFSEVFKSAYEVSPREFKKRLL